MFARTGREIFLKYFPGSVKLRLIEIVRTEVIIFGTDDPSAVHGDDDYRLIIVPAVVRTSRLDGGNGAVIT